MNTLTKAVWYVSVWAVVWCVYAAAHRILEGKWPWQGPRDGFVWKWLGRVWVVLVVSAAMLTLGVLEHWGRSWLLANRERVIPWMSAARIEAWSVLLSALMTWGGVSWIHEWIRSREGWKRSRYGGRVYCPRHEPAPKR